MWIWPKGAINEGAKIPPLGDTMEEPSFIPCRTLPWMLFYQIVYK